MWIKNKFLNPMSELEINEPIEYQIRSDRYQTEPYVKGSRTIAY